MIGTIRKHSTWMWGITITAVIISFVWMGAYTGSNQGGPVNRGTIYDRNVTDREFVQTYREMEMRYFFSSGEWPGSDATRQGFDPQRETYFRILLLRKAEQLGVHVSLDAVAKAANEMLRSMNRGNAVPMAEFVRQVLAPRGLTGADFERYLRHEIAVQQLLGMAGAPGRMVTPQDARALYEREHQEYVTHAVFYHPSNYVSGVTPTAQALGEFFTNQMARYRIPERLTVSYVKLEATNFFADAVTEINQVTNLSERLQALYDQRGGTNFYTDKTPAVAQAEILHEQQTGLALMKARAKANGLAAVVMEADPIRVENLAAMAATNGLKVEVTPPFTANEAPVGLNVGEEFVRAAFGLTEVEPVVGPVMGKDAVYIIALHTRLPSEVPPYEQVSAQVAVDYAFYESALAARTAGMALANTLSNAVATGKTFTAACAEAKAEAVSPTPFSLSSTNVPAVESHVNLNQFKQVMFMTPVGKVSSFVPNNDGGGFILQVEKKLPVDEAKAATALPAYMSTIRQGRQNDAVNAWVSAEAQRDAGFREIMAALSKQTQPETPGAAPIN